MAVNSFERQLTTNTDFSQEVERGMLCTHMTTEYGTHNSVLNHLVFPIGFSQSLNNGFSSNTSRQSDLTNANAGMHMHADEHSFMPRQTHSSMSGHTQTRTSSVPSFPPAATQGVFNSPTADTQHYIGKKNWGVKAHLKINLKRNMNSNKKDNMQYGNDWCLFKYSD